MSKSHMGIESISIRDFRGIDQLDLSFLGPDGYPTQIVVLAGPNGCGKTAVLEACMVATYRNELSALIRGAIGKEAIRVGCEDYSIDVTFRSENHKASYHAGLTEFSGSGNFTPRYSYFSSWRDPGLVGSLSIAMGKDATKPDDNEQNRLWILKQYLVNARAYEMFPRKGSENFSLYTTMLRNLNRAWGEFYPTHEFTVEPVSDTPDDGFDVFEVQENGSRLPLDMLSSGQLELFVLLGWFLIHKTGGGIILIDEPELHLDPQWHRQLLRALRVLQPKCQVIVATHSPEIYDSVRSFERHFLVPSDDPRAKAWQIETADVASRQ